MLGGRVRWEALSVVGQLGDGLFSRINVQKAFLGAAGFTLESGLADATDEEAQIKRSMVAAAREVIAIVDHTKWERAAFATFCPTDRDRRRPDRRRGAARRWSRRSPRAASRSASSDRRASPSRTPGPPMARAARGPRADGRAGGVRVRAAGRPRRAPSCAGSPSGSRRPRRSTTSRSTLLRRRGPRARRRERRRQEHAGQDPGRRPPARQRARSCSTASRRQINGPGARPGARHRGRPPGAAPLPGPDGRRERLHRPRAVAAGSATVDWGAMRRAARTRCSRSSTSSSTSGAPVRGLSMADQQLIEIAKALSVEAARADPRRADRVAVGARGRAAVHDRPPACATAASRCCS